MRTRTAFVLITLAIVAVVASGLLLHRITPPRVIGRAVAPDGTEMCIVQQFNWSAEFFTTSFVYRRPGQPWGWFYYDHQDGYWGSSRASLDPKTQVAVFYRRGAPAITFRWDTETYTMHRWNRTMTGAQRQLGRDWSPQLSVYSQ